MVKTNIHGFNLEFGKSYLFRHKDIIVESERYPTHFSVDNSYIVKEIEPFWGELDPQPPDSNHIFVYTEDSWAFAVPVGFRKKTVLIDRLNIGDFDKFFYTRILIAHMGEIELDLLKEEW